MSTFSDMTGLLPESQIGAARIEHFTVSPDASALTAFRRGEYVPPGRYTRLFVGGTLMMSDTPMERRTNYEVVRQAHGRVLIAGLGLGMILVPILAKPGVSHITVVEKSADVCALVGPRFESDRLAVVNADIYEWKPAKGEKFNVIYFDIWSGQSTDDLADMAKLHQRFKFHLDRTDDYTWMNSWNREALKSRKREEDRNRWW